MKWPVRICLPLLLLPLSNVLVAQQAMNYNLVRMLEKNQLVSSPSQQTKRCSDSSGRAISSKGVVWLKGINFTEGTIDIDLRGKNVFL